MHNPRMKNEFVSAWRFQQGRKEASGNFLFLQDVAAIDHQDLSGDVGSFRRGEEANRGGDFVRRAGAAERRMQGGDFLGLRRGCRCDPAGSDAVDGDSIAAFAAPYAAEPGLLTSGPVTDVTLTIRPYFCFAIAGKTARVMRKAVCRVIEIWFCHSANEVSISDLLSAGRPVWAMPALFTKMSMRPARESTESTNLCTSVSMVRSAMKERTPSPPASSSRARV